MLSGSISTGSPRYSHSRNSAATQDCGRSTVISSNQQEFISFQLQLCHRSGDARMKAECLKLSLKNRRIF